MRNQTFTFLAVLCLLSISFIGNSQTCIPDTIFQEPGLHPADTFLPCAIQGVPYDEAIQYKNFDTIDGNALGFPGVLLPVMSIKLDTITFLPPGMSYACDLPDCDYGPDENGCIALFGTTNAPTGFYCISISATINTVLGGAPVQINADSALLASAGITYCIQVIQSGDSCVYDMTSGIGDAALDEVSLLSISPNPVNDRATVRFMSTDRGLFNTSIVDISGREVYREAVHVTYGINTLSIKRGDLAPGVYLYNIQKENRIISKRFVISE